MKVERLKPRPSIPIPRQLLEQLRTTEGPAKLEMEPSVDDMPLLPEIEIPLTLMDEDLPLAEEEKKRREVERDTLDASLGLLEQVTELPLALDLVELDAEARERTIVLIDRDTGKLKSAQLHLPAYRNALDRGLGCSPHQGGQEIVEVLDLLARGFRTPGLIPIASQIHWFRLGPCGGLPQPVQERCCSDDDPIHIFSSRPRRHILAYEEMKEYLILSLRLIDVESTEAVVRYLLEGGFVMVEWWQLSLLQQKLHARVGARLKPVIVELGHPLFHSFYDITTYVDPTPPPTNCPAIKPLPALELDGRLIAVVEPRFNRKYSCRANKFYVNVLAYALIQPSPRGGRYLSYPSAVRR